YPLGWQVVIPHLIRCRNLVAYCDHPNVLEELLGGFRSVAVPLLERFQMMYSIKYSSSHLNLDDDPCSRVFNGGAPVLRDVRMRGLSYCLPPLTNVTSLSIVQSGGLVEWSQFRDILSGLLALTHLVIG